MNYLIYQNEISEENLIGNLKLRIAKIIHGDDIINIDYEKRIIIVKKSEKYGKFSA